MKLYVLNLKVETPKCLKIGGASIDVSSVDIIEIKGFASKLAKMAIANPLPASLESSMYGDPQERVFKLVRPYIT